MQTKDHTLSQGYSNAAIGSLTMLYTCPLMHALPPRYAHTTSFTALICLANLCNTLHAPYEAPYEACARALGLSYAARAGKRTPVMRTHRSHSLRLKRLTQLSTSLPSLQAHCTNAHRHHGRPPTAANYAPCTKSYHKHIRRCIAHQQSHQLGGQRLCPCVCRSRSRC